MRRPSPVQSVGAGGRADEAMKAEGAELATLLRAIEDESPPEIGVLGC